MSRPATTMACSGCGAQAPADEPYPFRCPNAGRGDDVDHVMVRRLDPGAVRFPEDDEEPNPFVRYRELFHSYHLARGHGMSDDDYVDLVRRLDKEVAGVDGRGFAVTPFGRSHALSDRLGFRREGGVWVKDETGNVSGSHKARHMMGLLVHLEVVERVGLVTDGQRELAIASCGNAALAAAVVAKAGGKRLRVFVPTWGDRAVVARLKDLGARVNVVRREEGVAGDPTYQRLQQAVREGALPFTCQGNENGLVIEGGCTLGYELASQLRAEGRALDRLFVQVGGAALASALLQGLGEAMQLGALPRMPRIHTVQTEGGYPLKRAYDRLVERIVARMGVEVADERAAAEVMSAGLIAGFGGRAVQEELDYARTHRSEFMWPWETEPKSIASGILDDETYDWFAVVVGLARSAGWPVTVREPVLAEANRVAREATGIDVDHTGSSGLAGLLELLRRGGLGPDERFGVLFTGKRR